MLKLRCLFILGVVFLARPAAATTLTREIDLGAARPALGETLPLVAAHVELPAGETVESVRVIPLAVHAAGPDELPAGALPADPVVRVTTGRLRGRVLAGVLLSPFLAPGPGGVPARMERCRLVVVTRPGEERPGDLHLLRETPEGSRTFGEAALRLTGNPARVEAGALRPQVNSGEPFDPTFRPSVDGSAVEMVIVTTDDQADAYQALADLWTKLGTSCVVRSVSWIQAHYPLGVDTAETIRNFLRDAAEKWGTAWVLLGGDTDEVPIRYGNTDHEGGENIPTDLYYADLDGMWNGDGDAKFGEGWWNASDPGDNVDLYPDVWVGRLPSGSAAEAQLLVGKTLGYLTDPPLGYQNQVLSLGEVLFPTPWELGQPYSLDGATYCQQVISHLKPWHTVTRLYENYPAWPGALVETKAAALSALNAGPHLVHLVGHGFVNSMSAATDNLLNPDAEGLVNGNELFLLYNMTCTAAAVDYNCIAERFLLAPAGGAVAVVGSTRLDFPVSGEPYQTAFFTDLFQNGVTEPARALGLAKAENIPYAVVDGRDRWIIFSQSYLGDPKLRFWTKVPDTLTVSHAATFVRGSAGFTVSVLRSGLPVDSALVCLMKKGDAYAVGATDSTGQVTLPFRPDLAGTFSVGVSVGDAIPYLGTAAAVAPGAPYLFARRQVADDDTVGGSLGNGDARLDAGETVDLRVKLRNTGGTADSLVTATLSTVDPYLTLTDTTASYPTIAAGDSVLSTDAFGVIVSGAVPDRHEAPCTLRITGAVSGTRTQEIVLYLHTPILEYRHQTVRDTVGNGNGNGVIVANEDFAILPQIRNLGLGDAKGLLGRLRSTDPAVTLLDTTIVWGDLPSEGMAETDGFAARFADFSLSHELRVVILDAYGVTRLNKLVDVSLPPQPTGLVGFGTTNSVALEWNRVTVTDKWGYAIYRGPTALGPFTRLNLWTPGATAYYLDEGLSALTRYYYAVAAVDLSGNEGPLSAVAAVTTTLPLHDGFPVGVGSGSIASVTIADLDVDGAVEILAGGEEIYAVHGDGTEVVDGDLDARTHGAFTNSADKVFWTAPAVGDVDGDGDMEVAGISYQDAKLHLVNHLGAPLPGFPRSVNPQGLTDANPLGSVCLGDVDADGDLEIVCSVGRMLFAWHHDGTELRDGDANPATNGVLVATTIPYSYSTPTVANIDEEPVKEIIAGMRDGKLYVFHGDGTPYPGFPFVTGSDITSSPAVGDVDGDGRVEIVFASSDATVHALRSDLTEPPGFPAGAQMTADIDSSPALGDLTGDGLPEIVIGASNGSLFAFSGTNGTVLPGFPILIKDRNGASVVIRSGPVLADVDGDGSVDILFGDQDGVLHAYSTSAQPLLGFPIRTGNLITGSPAVWDVDGDGLTEVLAESFDQNIYCWDTPWAFDSTRAVWPMFKRNPRHTGVLTDEVLLRTGVPEVPPQGGFLLLQNAPNPFHGGTVLRYRVPAAHDAGALARVELRVYDLSGRLVRTLVDGEEPPGLYELPWDARGSNGARVAAGVYFYRLQVGNEVASRRLIVLD